MRQKESNVRFWVWENGDDVRLTLRSGQELTHTEGGRDEEGYHYNTTTWRHCITHLICEMDNTAKDCDGRIDSHTELGCQLDELGARVPFVHGGEPVSGITYPEWRIKSQWQRDYSAEAMGY